jgi:hypothetical protein
MGSSRGARRRTTLGSAGMKLFWCGSVFMEICLLITLSRGTGRDHAAVVGFCSASFGGAKKTGRAGAEC